LMKEWAKKDPISNYGDFLIGEGLLSQGEIDGFRKEIAHEIEHNLKLAFDEPEVGFDLERELGDVYREFQYRPEPPQGESRNIRLVDAISQGLEQSMYRHNELIIMGQDIADYGGVFKVTEGFVDKFGKSRVRNTPICESIVVSAAMG